VLKEEDMGNVPWITNWSSRLRRVSLPAGSRLHSEAYYRALEALPQVPRIVYLLHSRDGLTYEAIAFRIGEDVAQVEQHLSHALAMLVRLIDAPDDG
jgi:DNA-directed RNA polymerase specialized sigma24 family protein